VCVFQDLVLEKDTKQLSVSLIWVTKFAFIIFSACFQITPNLDSISPFPNTLFFQAYPEIKFSSTGITFDHFCEDFFRSYEHDSFLAVIPLKCSVNLN